MAKTAGFTEYVDDRDSTIVAQLSDNTQTLFTGLPGVAIASRFVGLIVLGAATSSDNGKAFRFQVSANGAIYNAYDARIKGASAIQLQMSGCYICQ